LSTLRWAEMVKSSTKNPWKSLDVLVRVSKVKRTTTSLPAKGVRLRNAVCQDPPVLARVVRVTNPSPAFTATWATSRLVKFSVARKYLNCRETDEASGRRMLGERTAPLFLTGSRSA